LARYITSSLAVAEKWLNNPYSLENVMHGPHYTYCPSVCPFVCPSKCVLFVPCGLKIFEGRMKGRSTRGRKRIQLLDDLADGKDYASLKRRLRTDHCGK